MCEELSTEQPHSYITHFYLDRDSTYPAPYPTLIALNPIMIGLISNIFMSIETPISDEVFRS